MLPILLALGVVAAPPDKDTSPYAAHTVADGVKLPDTVNRVYRLMPPERVEAGVTYPLVVYLHGAGAKGDDNAKPPAEVLPKLLADPKLRAKFPCFVLTPQCRDGNDAEGRPNNWVKWVGQKDNPPAKWTVAEKEPSDQLQAAMAILDEVLKRHPIDARRVYLTGVSMGGSGSWYWAAREPERFAAVITACGLSEVGKAEHLAKLPIWAFHGSDDPVAPVARSRDTIAAIKKAGGEPKFTEFMGEGHGIASRTFTDNDHAALKWLFDQKRPEAKR